MSLTQYQRKRHFQQTPEPEGAVQPATGALRFVVQKHHASRLHYDFRLELDGVLKSWAVPKGPSLDPRDKRLAMMVEDHPLEYRTFEGIIPKGNYGAGTVMVWDEGTYHAAESPGEAEVFLRKGLEKGHLRLVLQGKKLRGEFALVKLRKGEENAWLLFKKNDQYAETTDVRTRDRSAVSGRTLEEIAAQAPGSGDVWASNRAAVLEEMQDAPKGKPPRKVKPMLATLVDKPFDRAGWLFEIKWDGYRAIAEVSQGGIRLYSPKQLSFNERYQPVITALEQLGHEAVLDGEIVVLDGEGKPRFQLLQNYQKTREGQLVYYVFDLLYLDGRDLRSLPLSRRKKILQAILGKSLHVRLSDHVEQKGKLFLQAAKKQGLEGIMAKDGASPYREGKRTHEWLKIKLAIEQREGGRDARAAPVVTAASRNGRKKGKEAAAPLVTLTHLDKIYWPAEGYTKGDLIDYYRAISPTLLPYLRDRPQSLNRFPNGIARPNFFQKNMGPEVPPWVHTVKIMSESRGKEIRYLLCQDEATLLYMANLGCIELNPWNSRVGSLDQPDFLILDLDPENVSFECVIEAAQSLRRLLDRAGAECYCKTSGKRGLHVCVPLAARYDYDQARQFAEIVAQMVHATLPETTSVVRNPAHRQQRLYLDYLQNRRGQTLAAPYSVRPAPGATVSAPLKWSEVKPGLDPTRFTMRTMKKRLDRVGDLWQPVLKDGIDLRACLERLASLNEPEGR